MITKTPLQQYLINHQCPTCKTGTLHNVKGTFLNTEPTQFMHQCNNAECNAKQLLPQEYPYEVIEIG